MPSDETKSFYMGQLVRIKAGPMGGKSGYIQERSECAVRIAMSFMPNRWGDNGSVWIATENVEAVNA